MAKKKTAKKISKKASKKNTKKVAKKSLKKAKKKLAKKITKKAKKKNVKKSAAKKTTRKTVKKSAAKKIVAKKSVKPKKTSAKKIQQTEENFTPHITSLKPGMPAPYFEGVLQDNSKITLNDLSGRKFVLYFYPKDDTPGCTKEACNIRDNYQRFLAAGYAVYGVSADSPESHQKFIEKYQLPFSLIADTNKDIIRAYDVWGKKQFMGKVSEGIIRTTFVIDESGIISDVITKVDTENHTEQILK